MEEIMIIAGSLCFGIIVAIVVTYSSKSDNKSEYIPTNVAKNLNNITEEEEFILTTTLINGIMNNIDD